MFGFQDETAAPTPAVVTAGGVLVQDGGPGGGEEFVADHYDLRTPAHPAGLRLVPCPLPPGGVRVRVRADGTVDMLFLEEGRPARPAGRVPPPTDQVEGDAARHPDPGMRRYGAGDFPGPGEDAVSCQYVVRVPGGLCVSYDDEAPSRGHGTPLAYFPADRSGTVCREQALVMWALIGGFALTDAAEEAGHLLRRLAARPDVPADAAGQLRATAADLHRSYQLQRLPETREPSPA